MRLPPAYKTADGRLMDPAPKTNAAAFLPKQQKQISPVFVPGRQVPIQYVKGPMIQREYKVKSVENHPTLSKKHLLLTMEDFNNFNNAEGDLSIEYDALNGNLSGRGGAVESFQETFTPEDLVQTPDPNVEEYISVSPVEVTVELKDVTYHPGYAAEYISAAPVEVTALLQDANIVNP